MPGMHGTVAAVAGLQRSDLIISLGARFDDRVTGNLDSFAPGAKVIHADIDPAEIGKNRRRRRPDRGRLPRGHRRPDRRARRPRPTPATPATTRRGSSSSPASRSATRSATTHPADGSLAPQYVIERLGAIAGPDADLRAGVGQHQMWAAHFVGYENPNTWINSGGLGTMGFAVPAAMGAKVGRPDTTVWAIDGDGCFQMTNQELATCAINDIPIKVAIINNESLGMVRQWQTLFYNERYSNTDLALQADPRLRQARRGLRLRRARLRRAPTTSTPRSRRRWRSTTCRWSSTSGSHRDAMVWPMVAAGTSNDDIKYARDLAPRVRRGRL